MARPRPRGVTQNPCQGKLRPLRRRQRLVAESAGRSEAQSLPARSRPHRGRRRQIEVGFVCDVRIRIQRDVGDRVGFTDEEWMLGQLSLHHTQCCPTAYHPIGKLGAPQ